MTSSLSHPVNNVAERILEYKKFKDDLIEYKCLCFNKNYQKKFDEKLKERFLI